MYVWLWRCGRLGGEWIRGLDFGVTNPVETWRVLDVYLFWVVLEWVMQVGSRWGNWTRFWKGGVCYVCVSCEYRLCVYTTGPCICILC